MEVNGKVVVVTGGGNGIGCALAERFHADGARKLVVADLEEDRAREVADTIDGDITSLTTLLGDRGADGEISLREAITAANNTPNGAAADEIHLPDNSTSTGGGNVIPFGGAWPSTSNPNGEFVYQWGVMHQAVCPGPVGNAPAPIVAQTPHSTHRQS